VADNRQVGRTDLAAATAEFWAGLLSDIEPTRAQKDQAGRSHRYLREALKSGQFEHRILDDYLIGSYARHTALKPQDDVDIIFVIDPTSWEIPLFRTWPDPAAVLASFARAVRYRYSESTVAVQRRSVRLDVSHVSIDFVPAIQDEEDPERIHVADVREFLGFADNRWIPSLPRRHARAIVELNGLHDGQFIPLVKLLKYWNSQLPEASRLRSFAIETLAATVFRHQDIEDFESALVTFFDYVAYVARYRTRARWSDKLGVCLDTLSDLEIPDLGGSGSNLAERLDDEHCNRWVKECIRARDLIGNALADADPAAVVDAACEALRL